MGTTPRGEAPQRTFAEPCLAVPAGLEQRRPTMHHAVDVLVRAHDGVCVRCADRVRRTWWPPVCLFLSDFTDNGVLHSLFTARLGCLGSAAADPRDCRRDL